MQNFIKCKPVYEKVIYRELVEASSIDDAEKGNYTLIKELEADFDSGQQIDPFEETEFFEEYEGEEMDLKTERNQLAKQALVKWGEVAQLAKTADGSLHKANPKDRYNEADKRVNELNQWFVANGLNVLIIYEEANNKANTYGHYDQPFAQQAFDKIKDII